MEIGIFRDHVKDENGKKIAYVTQDEMAQIIAIIPHGRLVTVSQIGMFFAKHYREQFGVDVVVFEELPLSQYQWKGEGEYPWWRVVNDDGTLVHEGRCFFQPIVYGENEQ